MNKTNHHAVEDMARDALNAITCGRDLSRWQIAVMRSIQLDAMHNAGRNVSTLADLGQYLGDDCDGYLSAEAERLQRNLDNLKG
ncbi:hypothetical protein [Stutzerimonas kunmingensis]|uniref:hypothetical protein n=1 Tax=Stutzerimonas kunmingensis TaxID=1211807 RepID=UPI0028A741D7|nr:hypothetical protein [Stutzerimonas kunmingensis]